MRPDVWQVLRGQLILYVYLEFTPTGCLLVSYVSKSLAPLEPPLSQRLRTHPGDSPWWSQFQFGGLGRISMWEVFSKGCSLSVTVYGTSNDSPLLVTIEPCPARGQWVFIPPDIGPVYVKHHECLFLFENESPKAVGRGEWLCPRPRQCVERPSSTTEVVLWVSAPRVRIDCLVHPHHPSSLSPASGVEN